MTYSFVPLGLNWVSGDKNIYVEWNPLQKWIKIQDRHTGEMMILSPQSVDSLINALQELSKKMNETEQ